MSVTGSSMSRKKSDKGAWYKLDEKQLSDLGKRES
jgi:hypothetical protein